MRITETANGAQYTTPQNSGMDFSFDSHAHLHASVLALAFVCEQSRKMITLRVSLQREIQPAK
jgi:hypothetical protein